MSALARQRLLILIALLVIVLADQVTKAIVVASVEPRRHGGTETTFFYITHERNPGLVFGQFGDVPWVARTAPVLASIVLIYLYRHIDPRPGFQALAFGLVGGGAIGNLIDRFFRGTVVDFLQFNFYFLPDIFGITNKRYPAFNIADTAICVGVAILVLTWHRAARKQELDAADAA